VKEEPCPTSTFDEALAGLGERLGHPFARPELLRTALTHRSFLNEHPDRPEQDNQRLEFLGDAVVQLVVSQELMARFPDEPEGKLTKRRALVVNMEGLAACARRLDLGLALQLGRGEERSGGRDKDSLLADAFEALAGALFLDDGFATARRLLLPLLWPLLHEMAASPTLLDAKSQLQELLQPRYQSIPRYRLLAERGPEHERRFIVQVQLDGVAWATGEGNTKKGAEQAAAARALERLRQGDLPPEAPAAPGPDEPPDGEPPPPSAPVAR
jgi:ribonuclease-3